MSVEKPTPDFQTLIKKYIGRSEHKEEKLAHLVQERFGHLPGFELKLSTISNWRYKEIKSVREWQKLIALAAVLCLSRVEVDELCHSAKLPELDILLKHYAKPEEQVLFQLWTEPVFAEQLQANLLDIQENVLDTRTEVARLGEEIRAKLQQEANANLAQKSPFFLPQIEISDFTGRESEMEQLKTLLLDTQDRQKINIVGLIGFGGIGKSTLAFHFATQYQEHFPGGVIGLRVDVGSEGRKVHIDTLAQRFAYQAGVIIDPDRGMSAAEIMQSVFREREALLIFDGVDNSSARMLHPGGNTCTVIVTTRNRGLLRDFGVPSTAQLELPAFHLSETKTLLCQLLLQERVEAEPEAVRKIHELLGGLPLALRLVGNALAQHSDSAFAEQPFPLAEYAKFLDDEKRLLRLRHPDSPDDPDLSVRASFGLSLKYLEQEQIALFACLGACAPEGFTFQTAQIVSGQDNWPVREGLVRLSVLSLINRSKTNDRFILHPLLHLFARDLARERDLLARAEQNHTEYFTRYVQEHSDTSSIHFKALEVEFQDILLAAHRLSASKTYDYYLALERFLQAYGYWSQALDLIDVFLCVAREQKDVLGIVRFLHQQGQFLLLRGQLVETEQILEESYETALQIKDPYQRQYMRARARRSLGRVYRRRGRLEEAEEAFRQSLALAEELGDEREQAIVLSLLGSVYQDKSRFVEAEEAFKRSLEVGERLSDERGRAMVLNSLGGLYQRQGKFVEAEKAFEQSLEIGKGLGDERHRAMVLNSLGGVYQRQGKFVEAEEVFKQSLEIRKGLGDERGRAMVLNSLGGVYQRQGKFVEAEEAFRQSLEIGERLGDERGRAMVLNSLGGVYQRQGKFVEAEKVFKQSLEVGERLGDERHRAMVLNSLGGVYQRQGKFVEAEEVFKQSLEVGERLSDERGRAMVLNSLGGLYQRQGKFVEAEEIFKQSLEVGERLGDERHRAMVLGAWGTALLKQGDYQRAFDKLHMSFEIEESLKNQWGISRLTPALVQVCRQLGRYEEAREYCCRALKIVPNDKHIIKLQKQIKRKKQHKKSTKHKKVK